MKPTLTGPRPRKSASRTELTAVLKHLNGKINGRELRIALNVKGTGAEVYRRSFFVLMSFWPHVKLALRRS